MEPSSRNELTPAEKRAALSRHLRQQSTGKPGPAQHELRLTPTPDQWHNPFPLTDVQQAYWLGQSGLFGLGNVATHMYFELDVIGLDLDRLIHVFRRLIDYHPMLRAVINPDGTQQVLPEVPPYQPMVTDVRGKSPAEVQHELTRLRSELSHQVLAPDHWPAFACGVSLRDPDMTRLHGSFSLLFLDAWSIRLLMAQWALLYQYPDVELPPRQIAFRDVVLFQAASRASTNYERARKYWLNRLDTLPPAPELPLACNPETITNPHFLRRATSLDAMRWTRLKQIGAERGLTPSVILMAAFSDVLRTWSRSARFTINLTLFNRPAIHPQMDELVGDFTSLTLLTAELRSGDSFFNFAERLQTQLSADLDHLAFGGVEVLRELWKQHSRPPGTIMPVVFTSVVGRESIADEVPFGEVVYGVSQTPQVWLDHQIHERAGALVYNWDYVEQLFPPGMMDAVFEAYTEFLRQLSEEPERWHERLRSHRPEADRARHQAVNATEKPSRDVRLETLFFEKAAQQPHAPAVVSATIRLTYAELARASRHIAATLTNHAVSDNPLVAVVMEKGWEQVAAVLGILRAGAAYLPIDPTLPAERIQYLLKDGAVRVALMQPVWNDASFWPDDLTLVTVDETVLAPEPLSELPTVTATDGLAYVIYTSGSTGQPKGVALTHRAVCNTLLDVNERFEINEQDRVLALSALNFDLSVYDVFGLLAAGGTIVIPEADAGRNPDRWREWIEQEEITVWNTVPALMEMLVEACGDQSFPAGSLRKVFLSGDWIPVSLPARIRRLFPNAEVISLGGATEAAIWSIYHRVETVSEDATSIPYGRPLANQAWAVLNTDGQPVPTWVPGELHIGGAGLAAGYWNNPVKTAAHFLTDAATGQRWYRTGDWGRYRPDGEIEFLGREDTQVKIHGHRIELGEIEAALCQHPDVQAAVVCAIGEERSPRRLMAWVTPRSNDVLNQPERNQLLADFLTGKLSAYMIPSAFGWRASLPLTTNGKVNRSELADSLKATFLNADASPKPPVIDDDLTREVWDVIATEMGLPQLGTADNLLHVGASSIDMIRLANRFEERFGFRPPLPDFFRDPTVNGLTALLRCHREQPPAPATTSTPNETPTAEMLLDPQQRTHFKQQQHGIRRFVMPPARTELVPLPLDAARQAEFAHRRSQRQFGTQPISLDGFSKFLSCLQQLSCEGQPKYRYGSAGGAYPVQTYVHLKDNAVTGFDSGLYYYHPIQHALLAVAPGLPLDREIHQPLINQPMFDQASFSIFLIGIPDAIEPLYGDLSLQFMTLEAGAMTQLLEESAARCQIGLCQIGWLDFERIRPQFGIETSFRLLHSLVGGPLPVDADTATIAPALPPAEFASEATNEFQEGEL